MAFVSKDIVEKLVTRLTLTEEPVDPKNFLQLLRVAVPITNLDELTEVYTIEESGSIDPGGSSWRTFITIPAGQRWFIYGYAFNREVGTNLIDGFRITGAAALLAGAGELFTAVNSRLAILSSILPVEAGMKLQLDMPAYAAGDKYNLNCLIKKILLD